MRKHLILLIATLFLVACGSKVASNVDEDLADDSRQIINIISDALEKDILTDDLSQEKVDILNNYGDKYYEETRYYALTFNDVEEEIITFTLGTITRYVRYTGLESDKNKILEGKDNIEKMIKVGKDYAELNK